MAVVMVDGWLGDCLSGHSSPVVEVASLLWFRHPGDNASCFGICFLGRPKKDLRNKADVGGVGDELERVKVFSITNS